jgi:hypothetical protein
MSEAPETTPIADELDLLKKRADTMGIKYHPSIGIDSLKAKIAEVISEPEKEQTPEPKEETTAQIRARKRKAAMRLRRIRVTCMNPMKRGWPGELFTISNSVVGTIKRYVPFDTSDGWHVEDFLLKMIKDRKYAHYYEVKENGKKVKRMRLVPEFGIEELPALTQKELNELAKRQAATGAIDSED